MANASTPNVDNCCKLFYSEPTTHDWKNCTECCVALGRIKCDGCKAWHDPDKLIPSTTMEEYKFCADCTEENPHFCDTTNCDGIVFGNQNTCNICLGEWVASMRNERKQIIQQMQSPVKPFDLFAALGNICKPQ